MQLLERLLLRLNKTVRPPPIFLGNKSDNTLYVTYDEMRCTNCN